MLDGANGKTGHADAFGVCSAGFLFGVWRYAVMQGVDFPKKDKNTT